MRVEPVPNSEYVPISELCLLMSDYSIETYHQNQNKNSQGTLNLKIDLQS